jgi:Bacterial dipeptidyl-peptidase Sh3 domain
LGEKGDVAQADQPGSARVRVGRPVVDASGRSRFGLTGVAQSYDARTVAIRADLADIAEAGRHFAPHYAAPMMRSVALTTSLRVASSADSDVVADMLPGEGFALLDVTGGVAWGYRLADHLVGYCPAEALGAPIAATHRVTIDAALYAAPDAAAKVQHILPAGSLVMGSASGAWLETAHGWLTLGSVEEVGAAGA